MSIYATQWVLRFPASGDEFSGCDWVEVICQGVPAHIGAPTPGYGYESGDPYSSLLPPAVPFDENTDDLVLRAVVVVKEGTEKVGQEYIKPLLVLSGEEYATMPFAVLHQRICDALRGDSPRLTMEFIEKGRRFLLFEDGSFREIGFVDRIRQSIGNMLTALGNRLSGR